MYEMIPRSTARASSPTVSVTKGGRITLNAPAAKLLVSFGVENVFLLWDAEARKFALKITASSDPSAYQVRFARENSAAGFSAKSFLRMVGYDFVETRALKTEWIENSAILEVTLPPDGFNRQRFPRGRKGRRSNGGKGNSVAAAGN